MARERRHGQGLGNSWNSALSHLVGNAPNALPRLVGRATWLRRKTPERPLFLIGCGRSGKTVLAAILAEHPQIALYPDEANHLWHPALYPWRSSPHRATVPPHWADPARFAAASAGRRTIQDWERLKGCFWVYQQLSGRRILLNESALLSFVVPEILREFPGCRIIHMVRDGRPVAAAWAIRQYAEMQDYPAVFQLAGYAYDFEQVLDRCAAAWAQQVQEVNDCIQEYDLQRAGKLLELRYEEFCAEPRATLAKLASFLMIDERPFGRIELDFVQNRNAMDLATLGPGSADRIGRAMREQLGHHGYLTLTDRRS